jgi:hypothetical protein
MVLANTGDMAAMVMQIMTTDSLGMDLLETIEIVASILVL